MMAAYMDFKSITEGPLMVGNFIRNVSICSPNKDMSATYRYGCEHAYRPLPESHICLFNATF